MQQARKNLPIGVDDFKKLITEGYYYVDKSLFINEVIAEVAEAALIPRPRRFGKTLNMSMLRYFFEKSTTPHGHLFEGLAIASYPEAMSYQGQYPVIFLTFKFADAPTWENCFDKLKRIIGEEYLRHSYLLSSDIFRKVQREEFEAIIDRTASSTAYAVSLKNLIVYLADYHNKAPIVLIDEYDVPLHGGFRYEYFEDTANFIGELLGDALKGNSSLSFAVVTGAMRVAKENIFTGMNNFEVFGLLDSFFADKFGLLESEVAAMLSYYGLEADLTALQSWYNGYQSGEKTVYNPWSIINCVKHSGALKPYWVNTSSNDMIKKLLNESTVDIKGDLELLLRGETLAKPFREDIVYNDLFTDSEVVWTFFFSSGYLTFSNVHLEGDMLYIDLRIPNKEVASFFRSTVLGWWLTHQPKSGDYHAMLESLTSGDIETFKRVFQTFVLTSFSYFDVSGKEPERFYHAFVLGLLVALSDRYEIKSNRESGYGRYDVMLVPRDITALGIVIEFKSVEIGDDLDAAVKAALRQIETKRYIQELVSHGVSVSLAVAIAFKGKEVRIGSNKS